MADKIIKKREANFSEMERECLVDLITEDHNLDIINSVSRDIDSNKKRNDMWKEIGEQLTRITGVARAPEKLKEKWSQMVVDAKKQYQLQKIASGKTGGGPAPPPLAAYLLKIIDTYGATIKFNGVEGAVGEAGVIRVGGVKRRLGEMPTVVRGKLNSLIFTLSKFIILTLTSSFVMSFCRSAIVKQSRPHQRKFQVLLSNWFNDC